jgi:hypothetical protein
MLYNKDSQNTIDPLDAFYDVLHLTWDEVCTQYDVQAALPETSTLLEDVEIYDPCLAAETILRNMLTEVTQLVHRFSPWFTLPPRSFGLISYRDIITHQKEWRLAPEALQKWQKQIDRIASEIDQKRGLIDAVLFIDKMDILDECPEDTIVAICECQPPKELLVKRAFMDSQTIICNQCKEKFLSQAA